MVPVYTGMINRCKLDNVTVSDTINQIVLNRINRATEIPFRDDPFHPIGPYMASVGHLPIKMTIFLRL